MWTPSSPAHGLIAGHSTASAVAATIALSVVCLAILVFFVYFVHQCLQRYYRISDSKSIDSLSGSSTGTELGSPPAGVRETISHSTPDFLEDLSSDQRNKKKEEAELRTKSIVKQNTLPTVPQRHSSFQRKLFTHRLDFGKINFTAADVTSDFKTQPLSTDTSSKSNSASSIPGAGNGSREFSCSPPFEDPGSKKTFGKIYLTLAYREDLDGLLVHIHKAEGLPASDFSGTADPYVKLCLIPSNHCRPWSFQTRIHRKSLFPYFDEKFVFHLPHRALESCVLQFSVYDFDRFSRHRLIGSSVVKNLLENSNLLMERHYVLDIFGSQGEGDVDRGQLLLSLRYLPTAGRLTISVLKANNIRAPASAAITASAATDASPVSAAASRTPAAGTNTMPASAVDDDDHTPLPDLYVKVTLMCHGRQIKKKKTATKMATVNPVYNEALVFDVPQENIDDVGVVVKVYSRQQDGSSEMIGVCAIGPQYVGIGRDHWSEMLEYLRKPVAQWYRLLEHVPTT